MLQGKRAKISNLVNPNELALSLTLHLTSHAFVEYFQQCNNLYHIGFFTSVFLSLLSSNFIIESHLKLFF